MFLKGVGELQEAGPGIETKTSRTRIRNADRYTRTVEVKGKVVPVL
jgi:hypothetical protein